MSQDYTGVTSRRWTESQNVTIEKGEVALVGHADGSLVLHIPGNVDDEATQSQQLIMLASLLLSGTPMVKPIFDQIVDLREQNLELASTPEDTVH